MVVGLSIVTNTKRAAARNAEAVVQRGITIRLILNMASKTASSVTYPTMLS
jgi:hypothetical protein